MRSNPNCPVCNCAGKDDINKLMYNGATPEDVVTLLNHQLARVEKEHARWMEGYEQKRGDETLRDTDIAEKNARLDAISEKCALADLTVEQLREHQKHATFRPNQSFKQPELDNGDVIENVNFSQIQPHTMIGEGVTGLVFRKCNLVNCDVPEGAVVEQCNTCQKSFCSHLHSEWVFEQDCERVCEHVVKHVPELVVEGVVVAEDVVEYEDKVVK